MLDGRYELDAPVGYGGMAEVWRARDSRLGRDVAVKVLSGPAVRDPSSRRRIEREARALASASHPNIVPVYDYGESKSPSGDVRPYVVMELTEGPDLHRYLEERGPLEPGEAQRILTGILAAVDHAHGVGIVHGDLKPANVLIAPHGPKVGDFGVARILAEETGTTTVAATPKFAAPEVLRGERPDERSDIYSAACLAFEMLAGRPPFEGGNAWEVATRHQNDPVPSIRELRPDVPEGLDEAIQHGLAKDPKARYASAAAFGAAIAAVDVDLPPDATVPVAAGVPAAVGSPATEALPGHRRADPRLAALFGPFAGLAHRIRSRASRSAGDVAKSPAGLVTAAVLVGLVLLMLGLSLRANSGVEIPKLDGQTVKAAESALKKAGLDPSHVYYSPVNDVEPGRVLRTIPDAGQVVEPGSKVNIVASAVDRRSEPEPSPTQTFPAVPPSDNEGGRGGEGKDKRKGGGGDGDDD